MEDTQTDLETMGDMVIDRLTSQPAKLHKVSPSSQELIIFVMPSLFTWNNITTSQLADSSTNPGKSDEHKWVYGSGK